MEEIIRGSNVEEVLRNTQYEPYELIRKFKGAVDQAIRNKTIKATQGMRIVDEYRCALADYTYLSD